MTVATIPHTENLPATGMGFRDRLKFAEMLVTTGFLPAAVKNAAQALAIIETGRELGIPPMHALRSIHIIQGKPSLSAELQLALFKRAGGRSRWEQSDAERATIWLRHPNGDEHTETFLLEDARKAGITNKDGWKNYPKAMLRARATSAGLRAVAPDIVAGLYDPEELGADVTVSGEVLPTPVDGTSTDDTQTVGEEGPTMKQAAFFEKLVASHVWTDEERAGLVQRAIGVSKAEMTDLIDEVVEEGKQRKATERSGAAS